MVLTRGKNRARRLTLAPSALAGEEDVGELVAAARRLLSETVEDGADSVEDNGVSSEETWQETPKSCRIARGSESVKGSRFWAIGSDDGMSEDEQEDGVTPDRLQSAPPAGSFVELRAAGGKVSTYVSDPGPVRRRRSRPASASVSVSNGLKPKPWRGKLPSPRRSPQMTIGAALQKAEVAFRATHWLRFWAQLQHKEEDQDIIKTACRNMEVLLMQIFRNYGWGSILRITL